MPAFAGNVLGAHICFNIVSVQMGDPVVLALRLYRRRDNVRHPGSRPSSSTAKLYISDIMKQNPRARKTRCHSDTHGKFGNVLDRNWRF